MKTDVYYGFVDYLSRHLLTKKKACNREKDYHRSGFESASFNNVKLAATRSAQEVLEAPLPDDSRQGVPLLELSLWRTFAFKIMVENGEAFCSNISTLPSSKKFGSSALNPEHVSDHVFLSF
ncbi:hypothetical protein VTI74DRAFT_4633 [Chaetomium olivicolor]